MAEIHLEAGRGPANPHPAVAAAADALWSALGPEGAGMLVEAIVARMDALDGDIDCEGVVGDGLTEDDEPDHEGEESEDREAIDEREQNWIITGGGSGGA